MLQQDWASTWTMQAWASPWMAQEWASLWTAQEWASTSAQAWASQCSGPPCCTARSHTHSAQPWFGAPLMYQSIPKHGSRKSMSRCPSLMGHLGVAVLGVAVVGTPMLGVAVLGTAVLHPPNRSHRR